MPFLSSYQSKKSTAKKINTSPSKSEIETAKALGINLGKGWRAYSREARLHIYVSDMKEMVRFYNQILEFPVVRYWRYSDGDGTMLDIGGNIIELFSKGRRNYSNKNYYGNVSLSIKVKNVSKLYDHFCTKNITLGELVDNNWGDTSFNIIDPEGNRLAFFTPNISKEKYYKVKSS
tara:strand:+ start:108 stop:635 length:528 start_codon:yes stop_codon:yes gene_type:complete